MTNFSLWTLFTSDVVTAIASIILVVFSVLSWAVIVEKIRLFRAVRRNKPHGKPVEVIVAFDKNLWFLAMVAGVSPFIGLFGTVWGVMDSFASIGLNQSVSIGVIAPGWRPHLGRLHWDLLPQSLLRLHIRCLPRNQMIYMKNWVGNNHVQIKTQAQF